MWMQSLFPDSPDSFRTEKDFKILREDSDENYMEGLMAEIPLKFLILRNLPCSFILEIFFFVDLTCWRIRKWGNIQFT